MGTASNPGEKGKVGEKLVSKKLSRLSKWSYIVLNDLMLLQGNRLTQIDHVVVSVYGIFVVETKNYQGEIFGNPRGDTWVQRCKGKKYPLHNPLWQNYAHIQALQRLLELESDTMFVSIAAFSNQAKLFVETEQEREEVVHFSKLRRTIRSYRSPIFTWEEAKVMAGTILCANLDSKKARTYHLDQIDSEIAYQNYALRNAMCPKCGGELVLRHGAYGDFYGCSRYPACRYILQIDETI